MPDTPDVDLSSCDREPIHIPGAIQPHGVLLGLSQPDFVVRVVSANCRSLVGREPDEVLGRRIDHVIRGDLVREDLIRSTPPEDLAERYPVLTTLVVDGDAIPVDAEFHRSNGLLLVEIEPAPGPIALHRSYRVTRAAVARINRAVGLKELYQVAVEEMRRLTGFDRVMVYRFDDDWNGDVVAEDRAEGLNSFLGLRYPASDIPAQARELYRTHWLRLIADVDYEPVPLVPPISPVDGEPVDLSDSTLRSVSPIHVEYLRNMGVTASMSVSLLDRGRLWGLIACHHYSGPHRPPLEVRAAAELLGQTLSLRLAHAAEQEEERRTFRAHTILASLMSAALDESRPALTCLTRRPHDLLDLTRATGCALLVDGLESTVGLTPPRSATRALVDLAAEGGHEVLALDRVPEVLPDLAPHRAVACGALVMRPSEMQYVVWFRPELVQTVSWGGDPANVAIARNEGDEVRLSPRKSFEVWQEKVRGRSEPWAPVDVSLAAELRHDLIDALYARSRRLASTATTLQRSLLPAQLPPVPGWGLAVDYRPSIGDDVGGDWYDVLVLGSGQVLCALGDVAGHGVAA
ncbi:GAF domain-containing protein, partial [Nocardioides sp. MAHUQ-72]|uniref:GAF domain-containing protein n=1 Tax=unclassified Nocardioides TaxID=2615069 RepID=UPI0036237D9F